MASVSDNLTITSVQARKAMLKAFKAKRPLFLWGPPGIGKSEVVAEVTEELGGHMIDLRMAQMEPTDIRGIPYFNRDINKMDWAAPVDLPDEELASQYPIVVLFLDEMNSASPAVQAAGYQLDYSDLEQEQIYQAMELAFNGDESILANLILEHLDKFES